MTKKTRRILFAIFLAIFIVVAPVLALYYQGYRLDLKNKKMAQTGGIFIKALPKAAEIYLDGKLVKKTDLFFGTALIENVFPQKHQLEVRKNGFYSWKKEVEIKEKEVTEAKQIVLFPQDPKFTILAKGIEDFWGSPDGLKLVFKEKEENSWVLKLYELAKQIKSPLLKETAISKKGADLLSLEISEDSKEIYLSLGFEEREKDFALGLDQFPPQLTEKKDSLLPEITNFLTYQQTGNNIYYLDNLGNLFLFNSSTKEKNKLSDSPFPIEQETKYKIFVFSDYIFLQKGENLYLFDQESKSFKSFFERFNSLKISPDWGKLVYFSDSEVWVFNLRENNGQPKLKSGEKFFLARFSEKIKDVFWLNSDYLVSNVGQKIKIIEVDKNNINILDLAEFKNPKMFWNSTDKKIYLLSEENLFVSEKLIP